MKTNQKAPAASYPRQALFVMMPSETIQPQRRNHVSKAAHHHPDSRRAERLRRQARQRAAAGVQRPGRAAKRAQQYSRNRQTRSPRLRPKRQPSICRCRQNHRCRRRFGDQPRQARARNAKQHRRVQRHAHHPSARRRPFLRPNQQPAALRQPKHRPAAATALGRQQFKLQRQRPFQPNPALHPDRRRERHRDQL